MVGLLAPEPPPDEVEAIIPPTALKTKIEVPELNKKKALKTKPVIQGKDKEPAGG